MDTILKRVMAFIIDTFIVLIIASVIAAIGFINPYKDEYENAYNEYTELVTMIQEEESSVDLETYEDDLITGYYNVNKYNVVRSGISIVCTLLYFGVLQFAMKGQTLGKKIMKIRVVANRDDKKLNVGNYLIRSVILNNIVFSILFIVGIYLLDASGYYSFSSIVSYLRMLVLTIIMLMVVLRKDFRGLHDFAAGTKVIDLNPAIVEENNEEIKVIETKAVEENTEKSKKKTNTTKKKASNKSNNKTSKVKEKK